MPEEKETRSQQQEEQKDRQGGQQQPSGQGQNQDIPLSANGEELYQQLGSTIEEFQQKLASKSNPELKAIADQLETIEREMLLEKINNELKTIQELAVKPGDIASAGAAAAGSVEIQQHPPNTENTSD